MPFEDGLTDRNGNAFDAALNGQQASDGKWHGRRRAVRPLLNHEAGWRLPHPHLLLLGGFVPTRCQPGLILSFSETPLGARSVCKCIMPGGFLLVVGGDLSEIGRHRSFRSPDLPGTASEGRCSLSLSGACFQRVYRQKWENLKYKRCIGREQVFRASQSGGMD
jgi:hypothetical protein